MAKFSTGLRTGMLGATGFKELMDLGTMRLFTGAVPADADAAETGTLAMILTNNGGGTGLTFATPADGKVTKATAEVWRTLTILATGNLSYYRFVDASDAHALSTTEPRVQGTIGLSSADMVLASIAVVAGATPWLLTYFSVELPTQ